MSSTPNIDYFLDCQFSAEVKRELMLFLADFDPKEVPTQERYLQDDFDYKRLTLMGVGSEGKTILQRVVRENWDADFLGDYLWRELGERNTQSWQHTTPSLFTYPKTMPVANKVMELQLPPVVANIGRSGRTDLPRLNPPVVHPYLGYNANPRGHCSEEFSLLFTRTIPPEQQDHELLTKYLAEGPAFKQKCLDLAHGLSEPPQKKRRTE